MEFFEEAALPPRPEGRGFRAAKRMKKRKKKDDLLDLAEAVNQAGKTFGRSIVKGALDAIHEVDRIKQLVHELQVRNGPLLNPFVREGTPFFLAVTGHRPNKLGDEWTGDGPISRVIHHILSNYVTRYAQQTFDNGRPLYLVSGMALGVDQIFAKIAIEKQLPFIAAIPCLDQAEKWPPESKRIYAKLLDNPLCTVHMVSDKPYDRYCMQRRNEFMVDLCDKLIAVWDGSSGGTANCIKYARKKQKEIRSVDPSGLIEQARLGVLNPPT